MSIVSKQVVNLCPLLNLNCFLSLSKRINQYKGSLLIKLALQLCLLTFVRSSQLKACKIKWNWFWT